MVADDFCVFPARLTVCSKPKQSQCKLPLPPHRPLLLTGQSRTSSSRRPNVTSHSLINSLSIVATRSHEEHTWFTFPLEEFRSTTRGAKSRLSISKLEREKINAELVQYAKLRYRMEIRQGFILLRVRRDISRFAVDKEEKYVSWTHRSSFWAASELVDECSSCFQIPKTHSPASFSCISLVWHHPLCLSENVSTAGWMRLWGSPCAVGVTSCQA